ncbi:MAG: prepilin peptidase [Coriobacteriales bacterium]|nr:prepilin peptidase [Coriobacteriales bacterium]
MAQKGGQPQISLTNRNLEKDERDKRYHGFMQLALNIVILTFVFVFGAVIASFLNVLIYRIPLKLDFMRGFSFCPSCRHRLGPLDLVPIVSYLALGRACRYCHEPISPRYLVIELAGGLLALACWLAFIGPDLLATETPFLLANPRFLGAFAPIGAAVLYFFVLSLLLVISCIDADTMEIPDGLNIALALCGLLSILVGPELVWHSRLIGLFIISVPLFVIALIIPGAFGGGDVKLMAAAGILLGWQATLLACFIGIILGGAWGIFLLATHRKEAKGHFAFGPALCTGIAVALFFAPQIIQWYLGFF